MSDENKFVASIVSTPDGNRINVKGEADLLSVSILCRELLGKGADMALKDNPGDGFAVELKVIAALLRDLTRRGNVLEHWAQ